MVSPRASIQGSAVPRPGAGVEASGATLGLAEGWAAKTTGASRNAQNRTETMERMGAVETTLVP